MHFNKIRKQDAWEELGKEMKRTEGNSSKNASESLPPQPPRKKKKTGDQRHEKAFEILTACSNQTMNDECQHFGNTIAANLRNYDTIRCVIQNDIISVFLNANSGFLNVIIILISSQLTHLKPTSHLKCTLKVSILFHLPVFKILLRHVLETLLRHHSVSTITHFCLTVFPQNAFRQLRHLQKKIHRCL
jgi:hypothetical protein